MISSDRSGGTCINGIVFSDKVSGSSRNSGCGSGGITFGCCYVVGVTEVMGECW